MNKRGQIYILAALILAVVIYSLSLVVNRVQQEDIKSRFDSLSENFKAESSKLMNTLMDKGLSTEERKNVFLNFTQLFTSYAKTVDPDFGLIYDYKIGDTIYLGNYLKTDILVQVEGDDQIYLLKGCGSSISASVSFEGFSYSTTNINLADLQECSLELPTSPGDKQIKITVNGIPYSFILHENRPELVIVAWEDKGEQRKVYTQGNILKTASAEDKITLQDYCISSLDQRYCDSNKRPVCESFFNNKDGCLSEPLCKWTGETCENL